MMPDMTGDGPMDDLTTMGYEYVMGLDVGKSSHHAWIARANDGARVWDGPVAQDEDALGRAYGRARALGRTLVVVDQTGTIGSLPLAVARDRGLDAAYLPGLAMRRYAQMGAGRAKTDRIDSRLIAECAIRNPGTLLPPGRDDPALAELEILSGHDDDLAGDLNACVNRLRALLLTLHPALERALHASRITTDTATGLLERFGGPHGLAMAGRARALEWARDTPGASRRLIDDVYDAIGGQHATVPGDGPVADDVVRDLARHIRSTVHRRRRIEADMDRIASTREDYRTARTMPGMGTRTTVAFLTCTRDIARFPDAAHLASYAGLAPERRQSGTSIRHDAPPRNGNRKLKRALYLAAAIAIMHDPDSRAYYQHKKNQGKHHTQALIALARRRLTTLYSMLKHHTPYQPPTHPQP